MVLVTEILLHVTLSSRGEHLQALPRTLRGQGPGPGRLVSWQCLGRPRTDSSQAGDRGSQAVTPGKRGQNRPLF